jgi:REP element-mobilizing transposase RayT
MKKARPQKTGFLFQYPTKGVRPLLFSFCLTKTLHAAILSRALFPLCGNNSSLFQEIAMPRPPRIEAPDALYHVTARGVQKSAIVRDDHDRVRWFDYLKEAVSRHGLELYAFALMDNHFHLFLSTPRANLSEAMQYLNGSYAAYFNARHERKGHLFENRYRAILIESQGHYVEVSRYVHLNPVRAGLVKRPEDYAWSSYIGYHSGRMPLSWLNYGRVLAEFSTANPTKGVRPLLLEKEARERYREFVAAGVGKKIAPPWAHAIGGWILGSPRFAAKTYALLAKGPKGDRWDSRAGSGKAVDATLDEIARAVCDHFNITMGELMTSGKNRALARAAFVFLARERAGFSLKSIGMFIGVASRGAVFAMGRRASAKAGEKKEFYKMISQLEGRLTKM